MKSIAYVISCLFLVGCGTIKDMHIKEQMTQFEPAMTNIHEVLPSNIDIAFDVAGFYQSLATESLEIIDVRVVDANSLSLECDPKYTQKYWYSCETAVGNASYFKDRFAKEKDERGNNFTATLSLKRFKTLQSYNYNEITKEYYKNRRSIVVLPFWDKYKSDLLLVSDAAEKYLKLNNAVKNELGPQFSDINLLPIKLSLGGGFSFQKLISAINESTNKSNLIARYKFQLTETTKLAATQKAEREEYIKQREADRAAQEEKVRQDRIAKQEFEKQQQISHKKINDMHRVLWTTKTIMIDGVSRGDQVCSYTDNKVGFVEDIVDSKLKVLWKASTESSTDGFWFGNMPFSAMDKKVEGVFNYQIQKMNDIMWVDKDKLSLCTVEL